MKIKIFTDGGARGNPGPAGYGLVIQSDAGTLYQEGDYLGVKTNNEAEYAGLLAALTWLSNNQDKNFTKITFVLDSQLLCRQMQGKYKVKAPHLKALKLQADNLVAKIHSPIVFTETLRENNTIADELANRAMDLKTKIN